MMRPDQIRKARKRWKTCGRKKTFETQRKANRAALRIGSMRSYSCPYCHCWHLTKETAPQGLDDSTGRR